MVDPANRALGVEPERAVEARAAQLDDVEGHRPLPAPDYQQAIMVAHGIGQQHPFQVLDSFAQNLRNSLVKQGYEVTVVHLLRGREETFDHCIRVAATHQRRHEVRFLDIYEYYWAPLTQGKASLTDTLRWVRRVALTPLQRLAYNVPLVRQLGGRDSISPGQFLAELWRVVYVLAGFLAVAAVASGLVVASAQLGETLRPRLLAIMREVPLRDLLAGVPFLVATIAFFAVLWSVVPQGRDLIRLRRRRPGVPRAVLWAACLRVPQFLSTGGRRVPLVTPLLRSWRAAAAMEAEAPLEIQARLRFLRYTLVAIVGLGSGLALALWRGWAPQTVSVMWEAIQKSPWPEHPWLSALQQVGLPLGLVGGALFAKKIFVDYVADIALYATADENSAFFRTRTEILTEATKKMRWLLRQPHYSDVGLAGHSLGSVIVYDVVSRLRVESQALNPLLLGQLPGAVQPGQLLGIPPVRLHPVPGTHGRQRRRDHLTPGSQSGDLPLHLVAAGPRFVDRLHRPRRSQAPYQLLDCRRPVLDRHLLPRALRSQGQYRCHDLAFMHIQTDHCATISHESAPPCYVRIGSRSGSNPRRNNLRGGWLAHSI